MDAEARPQTHYKPTNHVTHVNHFTDVPCGTCSLMEQCEEGGVISPSTCLYMDKWLQLAW
jgi:DNA-directed RNA polymerase III subunit RPC6